VKRACHSAGSCDAADFADAFRAVPADLVWYFDQDDVNIGHVLRRDETNVAKAE